MHIWLRRFLSKTRPSYPLQPLNLYTSFLAYYRLRSIETFYSLDETFQLITPIHQSVRQREDMHFYKWALEFARDAIAEPLERRQVSSDGQ